QEAGFQSSPAIGANGYIYIGSLIEGVLAIDSEGRLQWSYDDIEGTISSSVGIGPDGTIYVADNVKYVYAINSNSNGLATSAPWPMFQHNINHTGRQAQ
ncbi:MAG: PQQ-binding-like beta-propeller repeat protein, partial [Campylobacterota bacterium]|nr:PQQ-binding-like beta-propeller repeat protein [Campylobacterota bacterium]